jgi:hypothetical protein
MVQFQYEGWQIITDLNVNLVQKTPSKLTHKINHDKGLIPNETKLWPLIYRSQWINTLCPFPPYLLLPLS